MELGNSKNITNKQNQNQEFQQNYNINEQSIHQENSKLNSSVMSSNVQIILKQIFEFYCQFGERLNTLYLKSHKFFKFASEANIYDNNLTKIKLELIFKSEVGNNQLMDFKAFLNSLIKIADVKYNYGTERSSVPNKIGLSNNNRISSGSKLNSSAAYAINKSSSINQSFNNSQILENKKNKSFALGRLINETLVPLHCNIFNKGSLSINPFEQSNSNKNDVSNMSNIQGMNKSVSQNVINITRLDHKSIAESKFIENLLIYTIPNLYDIYRIYFPHEVSISEDEKFIKESSYKKYLIFLKEFDLCPGLISKTISFQIFQNEVINPEADADISENQEYYINLMKKIDINELIRYDPKNANIFGQFLNFFKFIRILVKISQAAYDNINVGGTPKQGAITETEANNPNNINRNSSLRNINYNNYANLTLEEKLILTFERMELSEGFLNLEKKTMKTHSQRTATLIPAHMLNNLKLIYSEKLFNNERNSLLNNPDDDRKNNFANNIRLANNYKEICEFTGYIMENWGDELHAIYKGYCSYGDYLNTKYMTSKKFFKFLNDCKLLEISVGNFYLNMNESSRSLNISRSVDNKLINLTTPKGNLQQNNNYYNMNKVNPNIKQNQSSKNNLYYNPNEKEINFGNLEGAESQILPGLAASANRVKLLKPNDIDSIFIKLCALVNPDVNERQSYKRDPNMTGVLNTGNTSTNDLLGFNNNPNVSRMAMERSSSTNKLATKKIKGNKIEFDLFIIGLEIIARFIFDKIDVKNAIDKIILEYVLKNVSSKYTEKFTDCRIKIEYLKKKQDDPELLKVLEIIYDTFSFAYLHYADKKGLMSFNQLMK